MKTIELKALGSDESIEEATLLVLDLCREQGYTEERRWEIATALHEAFSNAREHAHAGDATLPIDLTARVEGDGVRVEVHDGGPGLPEIPPLPDLARKLRGEDRCRGWGVFLMRSLASRLVFVRTAGEGHTVRLIFGPAAPSEAVDPEELEETDDD